MSDKLVEQLRGGYGAISKKVADDAADEIERLRKALDWLLHETMYKDHPEASQNAMDVLGVGSKPQGPVL